MVKNAMTGTSNAPAIPALEIEKPMSGSNTPISFKFEEIADFDARRRLTRCAVPGIGMRVSRLVGNVDFWRNGAGDVLVRFESTGYRFSFCARTTSGAAITDDEFEEFTDHVSELLHTWLCDGVDDTPET